MKKQLLFLLVFVLSTSSIFAQGKPNTGKQLPSLQKIEGNVTADQTNQLFQQYLQSTTEDQFILTSSQEDELGFLHQKFQQYHKDVPVDGRTITVHSKNNLVQTLSGNYKPMDAINTNAGISEEAGLQKALNHVGAKKYAWQGEECVHEASSEGHGHSHGFSQPKGDLVVFAHPVDIKMVRLAYKFDIYASDPLYRAYVYVDAQNGDILFEDFRIHNTDTGGTCSTLYNGTQSITVDNTGSNYRLRQTTDGNGIETYDMNNGTNYSNATDITSPTSNFGSGTAIGNQAHFGAEKTHQYFMSNHNRNSYDNNGSVIKSYVSYSNNYVNAFWNGSVMTYGDGNGTTYFPLVSLDIVGHEVTHGVTQHSANLVYAYESGALNESFSDIFGESIENFAVGSNDWLMGDDIGPGGSGGAFRSMMDPKSKNDPDTYGGTHWHTGSSDNGGVHTNSGVQNKWFYILSEGEIGTNDNGDAYDVTGLGMTAAGAIAYRNLTVYLTGSSQYSDARTGAIQSAIDLYGLGSAEEIATTNAWYAVGVGPAYGGGGPGTCFETVLTLTINFDNYPEETSWKVKDSLGVTVDSAAYSTANPDGSTITETINLPAATYTFTIYDSYGDGICCGYGNGSYSLDAPSGNIVAGGSFGALQSTLFCTDNIGVVPGCTDPNAHNYNPNATVDDGSCETCMDGIMNGDETSIDCGGNLCGPCLGCTDPDAHNYDPNATQNDGSCETCTDETLNGDETGIDCGGALCIPCPGDPVIVFAHYFETGLDGWADGGSDCYRYSGPRSWEGTYSIRLRDNTNSSKMTSPTYDLSGFASVDLEFTFYPNSMESGEDFWVQIHNGSGWNTIATFVSGTDFSNNNYYTTILNLTNISSNSKFRFRCDASANNDRVYIDAVILTGNSVTNIVGTTANITEVSKSVLETTSPVEVEQKDLEREEISLYPNPAGDFLNIKTTNTIQQIKVYSANGNLIKTVKMADQQEEIDIAELNSGFYYISVETEQGQMVSKFVKL